ncbi:hypothetical protein KFL_002920100 [Klebsormidium nitens]|uniref:Uncharacterized protein n=1 Tax=Klebsormidium nitens TaxID=105231 RepID=A0A1Y1I7I8_KLENI|nr:hypothetical protein KFL_002920100 [Klebsormidium nitens]|eukprot:GAQ86493.1 hypothetical protein KFL_002920100 [Klebsormidium nitens]
MADLRAHLFSEAERALQTLLDNHVVSAPTHASAVSILKHERDGTPVAVPPSGAPPEPLGGADPALKAYLLKEAERELQNLHDNRFLTPDSHARITALLQQTRDEKGIPQAPPVGYIPPVSAYSPSTQPQVFQGYAYQPAAYAPGYPQPGYGGYAPAYDQQGQYGYPPGQYGQQPPSGQYGPPPGQYGQQPQYGQPYGQPYPYSQQYPQQYSQQQPNVNNPGIVGTPNVTPLPPPEPSKPQAQAPPPAPAPAPAHAAPAGPKPPSQWGQFAGRMGNNIANGMSSGFGWTMGGNVANEVFHDTMHAIHKIT